MAKPISKVMVFGAVLTCSQVLWGQQHCNQLDSQCASGNYLEEIVVTATRTSKSILDNPNSISLVTEQEMSRVVSESLADVLRDLPGVNVTDSGQAGMKRIRIRGEASYRIAMLIDGQEVTDHRGEGVPLLLHPSMVERIEVVKGAGSVLYGPKALGGVINFVTRKGGHKPLQVTASVSANSATTGEQYFLSGYGSKNDFDYRVAVSKSDDNDRKTPDGEISNTSAASDSAMVYLGKRLNDHELAISWDKHDAYSEVFVEDEVRFAFPFNEFAVNIPQRDRSKLGLFYTWENPTEKLKQIHFDGYQQVSDRKFETYWSQVFGTQQQTYSQSELITVGAQAQFDLQVTTNHYLIAGMQYTKDNIDQDRLEIVQLTSPFPITQSSQLHDEANLETKAIFAQDEWQISDTVMITAGLRKYWIDSELELSNRAGLSAPSNSDSEIISALAATWELSENSILRASYSEGYIYPSLLQLSVGAIARTFVNPNPDLKPEQSETYELGWRFDANNWFVDLTAFYTNSDNYIDRVSCVASPSCIGGTRRSPAEIFVNVGEANTRGIEALAEYRMNNLLTAYSRFTWLKREHFFESFNTHDTGLPDLRGSVGMRYESNLDNAGNYWIDGYIRGETAADEVTADASETHNAGWLTTNIKVGLDFGEDNNYHVVMEFNNLLDKRYSSASENLLAPERSVLARLEMTF